MFLQEANLLQEELLVDWQRLILAGVFRIDPDKKLLQSYPPGQQVGIL